MKNRRPLTIPADHPAFAGHFPGRPILPGVVLLDAVARAIAAGLALEVTPLWRVDTVKFLQPALPGDSLTLEWEPMATGEVRFIVDRGGQPLTKGTLHHARP